MHKHFLDKANSWDRIEGFFVELKIRLFFYEKGAKKCFEESVCQHLRLFFRSFITTVFFNDRCVITH